MEVFPGIGLQPDCIYSNACSEWWARSLRRWRLPTHCGRSAFVGRCRLCRGSGLH